MKLLVTTLLLLLALSACQKFTRAEAQTIKNANGQIVGRAVTNNVGTQFYNASGQNTGRSVTNNAGTTFYNASGQTVGRTSGGRK
jgi:hypothetical protein